MDLSLSLFLPFSPTYGILSLFVRKNQINFTAGRGLRSSVQEARRHRPHCRVSRSGT